MTTPNTKAKVVELRLATRPGKVCRFGSEDEAWAYVLRRYPNSEVLAVDGWITNNAHVLVMLPCSDGFGHFIAGTIDVLPGGDQSPGNDLPEIFKDAPPCPARKPTDNTLFGHGGRP